MKAGFAVFAGFCLCLSLVGNIAHADALKIRIGWIVAPAELTPDMFAKEGIARHNGVRYTLDHSRVQRSSLENPAAQSEDLDVAPFDSSSFAIALQHAGLNDLLIIPDEIQDDVPG